MTTSISRSCRYRAMGAILLLIFVAASAMPSLAAGKEPVGTIEMKELQIAWIGSGNFGDGKLHFNGETYPFKISGLGVGGFGISTTRMATSMISRPWRISRAPTARPAPVLSSARSAPVTCGYRIKRVSYFT